MNKQDNHISDELLGRFLAGDLSAEELERVRAWASQSADNQLLLDDSTRLKEHLDRLKVMERVSSLSAHRRVKQRIGKPDSPFQKVFVYWQRVAAILVFPLLGYLLFQFIAGQPGASDTRTAWNEVVTPVGMRSAFTLPDGTKVWLNGNTSLKYPLRFSGDERLVKLRGEAFFEVVGNPKKPFVVDAAQMLVQAVGTSFNVQAFPDDNEIETVLVEGKVNLLKPVGESRRKISEMDAGQLVIYLPESNKIQRYHGNLEKFLAWRQGKILFRNDPLEEVTKRLGQWYNVDFIISDQVQSKGYAYTGSFQGESLHQILEYIELTTPVKFTFSEPRQSKDLTFEKRTVYVEMQRLRKK